MNWLASSEPEPPVLVVAEPEMASRTAPAESDTAGGWLCSWCLNRVSNDKDRFQYSGQDEFSFANPEGIRFAIITFTQTLGYREQGEPTLDHTWFPGHAWTYCHCERCGRHLGWHYTGQHDFAGLIKDRIVRAAHVRN